MHPPDCPEWEYKNIPDHEKILMAAAKNVAVALRSKSVDAAPSCADTRPIHRELFCDLVTPDNEYLAGHYRGEDFRCLKDRPVFVPGDPRVGCPPHLVHDNMALFSRDIRATIAGLDAAFRLPNSHLSKAEKLRYAVMAVCRLFEIFLRIHPYANGNGHVARFCLVAILGRYGYWLPTFPIEPRPQDPPYTNLITEYRDGNKTPLESFILQCIAS